VAPCCDQWALFSYVLPPLAQTSSYATVVMESRDLVSISRPIFASLGLNLKGFRSRLGLEGYSRSRQCRISPTLPPSKMLTGAPLMVIYKNIWRPNGLQNKIP